MKSSAAPWPRLLALGAAVLAAHLWSLQAAPRTVRGAPAKPTAFVMRSIAAATPSMPPAAAAQAPPSARPQAPPGSRAGWAAGAGAARPLAPVKPVGEASPSAAVPPQRVRTAPAAAPEPQAIAYLVAGPVRLHYEVTASGRGQDRRARSELDWRHDGASYEASFELIGGVLPARTQRSTGHITAQGLAPRRFSDKARSEQAAHFQHDQGKVSFSSNRPDAPLLAGAQDRLSVLLQLGAMVAGDPRRYPPGTTIVIQTAGTHEADPWLFVVEGQEELLLPGGALQALKFTRSPRKEFDQKVEVWLAPTMDYVPVRLRLTQPNGDWLDQQWSSTDRG